jgi:hypothetical protein
MPKEIYTEYCFPKQRKARLCFGEYLLLAMKRREITKQMMCNRTGFNNKTVNKVFAGGPGVAIGTYIKVMAVLGKWCAMNSPLPLASICSQVKHGNLTLSIILF